MVTSKIFRSFNQTENVFIAFLYLEVLWPLPSSWWHRASACVENQGGRKEKKDEKKNKPVFKLTLSEGWHA